MAHYFSFPIQYLHKCKCYSIAGILCIAYLSYWRVRMWMVGLVHQVPILLLVEAWSTSCTFVDYENLIRRTSIFKHQSIPKKFTMLGITVYHYRYHHILCFKMFQSSFLLLPLSSILTAKLFNLDWSSHRSSYYSLSNI